MPSAARVHWAKFRVALVALAAVVILCVLLYDLFGGVLLAPKTVVYLYIPDASGLSDQSPVLVDGINVGRVSTVQLSGLHDPNRVVKVGLLLYRDRISGIPADSVAQISTDSLIGDKFVDVTSGTSAAVIPPAGEMIYKYQPELLKSLDLTEFTRQLRVVDQMLADIEAGRNEFGQFFQGTEFYNDLIRRMTQMQRGIRAAVSPNTTAGALIHNDELYRQATDAAVQIDNAIAKIQSGQGPAGQLLRDTAQYDQLLNQAREFHRSIESLSKNSLMQTDEVWVSLHTMLGGMMQTVDQFNRSPGMTTAAFYDELNGSLKEFHDTLHDFRTNPTKFMRIKLF